MHPVAAIFPLLLVTISAAAAGTESLSDLAGCYIRRHSVNIFQGKEWEPSITSDHLKIAETAEGTPYVWIETSGGNGDWCGAQGSARFVRSNSGSALELAKDPDLSRDDAKKLRSCRVLVQISKRKLVVHAPDGNCDPGLVCGDRSSIHGVEFLRSTRLDSESASCKQ